MRIVISYRGNEKTWETPEPEVVFGRTDDESATVLDLFPDKKVSRAHGRIWDAGGLYWIEDLNSKWGTRLNGVEIKGRGKHQVRIGDLIVAGDTTLRLDPPRLREVAKHTRYLEQGTMLVPESRHPDSAVAIAGDVSASLQDAVGSQRDS